MQTIEESIASVKKAVVLPPQVLNYEDYHLFLHDFYHFKKIQNRRFSYRVFAARSGLKSSNFLMLVMKNERRLSPLKARAVAKAMSLAKKEADYFCLLVRIEQCQTEEERVKLEKDRRIAIANIVSHTLPKEKSEYLRVWYYSLIRELAFLPDFVPTGKWISEKLLKLVNESQAEKAIEILFRLGLWKINSFGKVNVTDVYVTTGSDEQKYQDVSVTEVHKGNMRAWIEILSLIPAQKRELGLLNIPINSKNIPELKNRIRIFQDEIIGWLQDEKDPDQLIQIGTYMVPVTRT